MLPEEFKSARILLIDDQRPNLDLLEAFLGDAGYTNLHCTRDPRQVPELLRTIEPDLIVLDLHMPQMDGFEVMAALRPLIPAETYLPIIVLTADATREARERALSGGANDFLTKPLDEIETLLRIRFSPIRARCPACGERHEWQVYEARLLQAA